jgi:hypothetical protein
MPQHNNNKYYSYRDFSSNRISRYGWKIILIKYKHIKFFDAITKNTIRDEINRICGITDAVYSLKDKIARVNQALDKYWYLASSSAPKGSFDDVNNATLPVEKQNLADGANAYKIGTFTNEVLQILRVAILNDDAKEIDLVREEFDDIAEFNETYSTDSADRGTPTYWTKYGDFIYLRACPDYDETDGLRAYVNKELSKLAFVTFTITIASPGVLTATAHGLSDGDAVILSTNGTLPTGLTADTTVYYLVNKATDTFQLATVPCGTAVNTTGAQTGTHGFVQINKTPGIPVIHHDYLARWASKSFLIEKKLPQLNAIIRETLIDEKAIQSYWQNRGRELRTIIRPRQRIYK